MFLAHCNSIEQNHFKILPQLDNNYVLVNSNGFKLVSNICPHQNSLISEKDGKSIRVCPYHSWSFTLEGQPLTSGRTEHYCKNNEALETRSVYQWNHLLFNNKVNFDIDVNFEDLILMEERTDVVNADHKIIMDIFLDVDHIQSVHSGVYDLVGIRNTDVDWNFFDGGSVQKVEQGAFWIAVYPNTMIEWQKGSLFVTVAVPSDKNKTKVHVFKYLDKKFVDSWKLNEFVWETAWLQDRHQSEILKEFPKKNLEAQKLHFREYCRSNGIH